MRPQPDRSRLSLGLLSTETETPAYSGAASTKSGRRSRRDRRRVFTVEWLEGRTLLSSAPSVANGAASSITLTGATLGATVNPNGSTTTALFQYSTSPTFTPTVATVVVGFLGPTGVALDAAGDVFVADQGTSAVYVVLPNGTVNTIGSGFSTPTGVAVDAAGDVFVADTGNNAVKEVLPNGTINTIGSGFLQPQGVAVNAAGDVFVADTGNSAVKEVLTNGTINTIGSGLFGGSVFLQPRDVALDAAGDVYVADFGASAVYEVLPNGTIDTIGSGFSTPTGVAVDGAGDVFVADRGNLAVKEVLSNGTINTIGAGFGIPRGVAVDTAGDVFVADKGNQQVIKISPPTVAATPSPLMGTTATAVSATLTGLTPDTTYYDRAVATNAFGTVAASAGSFITGPTPTVATGAASSVTTTGATLNGLVNPNGSTTTALFQYSTSPAFTPTNATAIGSGYSNPIAVAVDTAGDVFVADQGTSAVYEVLPNDTINTIGSGFSAPSGVAVNAAGDVFVADSGNNAVKEVLPNGTINIIGFGFNGPNGVALDSAGDVFVADTGNNAVKEVLPDGTIDTIGSGFSAPSGVAVSAAGDVFVADTGDAVVKVVVPNGTIYVVGTFFRGPRGVAVNAAGDVFVADGRSNAIYEVLPNGSINIVGAGFLNPRGVALDTAGDVFVADSGNSRVVELSTPTVAATPSPLMGTTATAVSATLTGLTPGTTYYDRVVATSARGTATGSSVQSFTTTPATPPTVATGAASSVTATGATLNATVNPDGYSTNALFQYSTSPAFTPTVASAVGSGFSDPFGVAVDSAGAVFVADSGKNAVYEVLPNGTINNFGSGFNGPSGVAVDAAGDVFVSDLGDHAVYEVLANGTIKTIGSGFNAPTGLAVDASGDVFVADIGNNAVYEVLPNGTINTIGSGFINPVGVAVDAAGDVFVAAFGNNAVYEVLPNGTINTIGSGFTGPYGVAVDAAGDVFVVDDINGAVFEVLPNGTIKTLGSAGNAQGVAVDAADDVFVTEDGNTSVVKLSPPAVTATPSPLTGTTVTAVSATLTGLTPGTTYYDRIVATSAGGNVADSSTQSFTATQTTTTTTTTLTSSANPAYLAQPVTFTAVVAPVTPGGPTPTGSVTFLDNGTALDSSPIPLDATGTAVFTTSSLWLGTYPIIAVYSGDPYNATSSSSTLFESVVTIPTTTTLASSASPVYAGQPVTFTAVVAPVSPGGPTPAGPVMFLDNGIPLNAPVVPLDATGTAVLTTSLLAVGTNSITAVYPGDPGHGGSSSSPVSESVVLIPTTTTLTSSASPAYFGQSLTLTAVVAAQPPGLPTPTGSVQFFDNGTALDSSPIPLDGTGTAVFTESLFELGTQPITAVYSGDANNATSSSSTLSESVVSIPTTTTLTTSANPVYSGQNVTFTAVVAAPPGLPTPAGDLLFLDNGIPLNATPVALDATGTAVFTTSSLALGTHPITAYYFLGDPNDALSNSSTLSESVVSIPTTTTLTSTASTVYAGQSVTLTAVVAAQSQGLPVPTGSMQFFENGTALDSSPIPLDGTGTATFTTSLVELGTHPIVAIYSGDPGNATSSSLTVSESVVPIPTPTVATGAAGSVTPTGATLSATVNPDGYSTTALFQYSTSPTFTPTVQTTIATGFSALSGLAADANGDVFVADSAGNAVDEVLPDGTIKTIGSGLFLPVGVAVDAAGDVFVATPADSTVKEVLPSGTILTVGSGFSVPQGVGVDAAGDVFVADTGNNAVEEVMPSGTIKTVGSGFDNPHGVAVDAAGDVFVADTGNSAVKEVLTSGNIKTIVSGFNGPVGVAVNAAGDVFVAGLSNNAVEEVLTNGNILSLGSGFNHPVGVAVDAAGDVFVADLENNRVVELSSPTIAATPTPLTGTTSTAVSAALTGLTPGTTYYDRVVATNAFDTVADTSTGSFITPNVPAPTAGVTGPSDGVLDQPRNFTFTAGDSFTPDNSSGYTYSINWGDGSTQTVSPTANNTTIIGSHAYTITGTFPVSVLATDQFGTVSTAVMQSITIGLAQVQADGASQGGTAGLAISGSSAAGGVILAPGTAANSIKVTRGGTVLGTFVPTGGNIAIYGDGGTDLVTVTGVASSADTFTLAGNTATFTAASLSANVFTIALNGISTVTLQGGNSGNSFTNTVATVASVLVGGTGANTYTFAGTGMGAATTVQGKGASNTLNGPTLAANQTNVWTTNGTNAGNLNGANWTFTGVQNLVGGANDDQFEFIGSGSVAGSVSGAGAFSAAGNTLDFSGATAATVSVNLATSKATGIGTTFAGVQTVTGQLFPSMPDTLTGASAANAWAITGANSGTVSGLNFASFGNLTGGTAVDTFTVGTSGSLTGTLNGGGGSNILVGPNLPSTFNITAKNAGNLTSSTGVLNFTSIPNLTGGAQANVFAFSSGVTIAGNLSGGTLNYTGYTTAVTVNLQTNKVTGVTGLATDLAGAMGASGASALIGANTANAWNITGPDSGTVNTFTFTNFGNLTGGTLSDTFTMGSAGSLTGTLTGTAGSTSTLVGSSLASSFTITAKSAGTFTSSSGIVSFKGITILVGVSGGDALVGANTANTWNISGPNSGTLNAFTFAGIANLTGGTAADTFTVGTNGSLTGTLSGGGGTNTLIAPNVASTITLSGSNAGNLSTSTPVIPMFTQIAKVTGGTAANTLIGASGVNTWNITGNNAGNINGLLTFTAFANLTGGSGNDDFVFSNGKGVTGTIAGEGGTDQLDYSKYTTGVYVNLLTGVATGAGGVTGISQVKGSGHNDVLVGNGTGVQLVEAAGKNLIIGGTGGQATIDGGSGQDIVIAGSTIYDNNQGALQAIESYWSTNAGTFAARVAALSSTSGITGGYQLNTSTVTHHSGSGDTILLVSANDWIFWSPTGTGPDTVTGTPKQSTTV